MIIVGERKSSIGFFSLFTLIITQNSRLGLSSILNLGESLLLPLKAVVSMFK